MKKTKSRKKMKKTKKTKSTKPAKTAKTQKNKHIKGKNTYGGKKNKDHSQNTDTKKNKSTKSTKSNKTNKTNNIKTIQNFKQKYDSLVKLQCSPKTKDKDYSCLSDEALYKLRDLWNARHPDVVVKSNDPKEIWEKMKEYMKNVCNKESCWLKQNFVNGELDKELETSFAPSSPTEWKKNPNAWLSSVDILNVMKQYEDKYKCFEFIGPSPIDYDTQKLYGECVWEELCHFNLENQIKNGKTKIGVIFNLDPHNLGGSHWVSLFVNIKNETIFYFDSAGDKIPGQIHKFVKDVISQGQNLKHPIKFTFDQNHPVEHQYGDTECGIYSIFFIVHMLDDKISGHYLKTHILKDEYMEKFRKVFFNDNL